LLQQFDAGQFLGSFNCRIHRVHDQAVEAAIFKGMQGGDGGATRRADPVAQHRRMLATLLHQACGPQNGLHGQSNRHFPRQSVLDTGVCQRLDEGKGVGRSLPETPVTASICFSAT